MKSMKLLVVVVVALVMGLVACSQDEAAPSTEATEATTTSSSTTTTSAPSTTTETTVDPAVEAEVAVEAAYMRSYEVFTTCYRTLPDCDPAVAFAEVYTGGTYERLADSAEQSKADGLVYEPPADPAYARTEILDIALGAELDTAVVTFCTLAGDTELAVSEDGSRIPVGLRDNAILKRLRINNISSQSQPIRDNLVATIGVNSDRTVGFGAVARRIAGTVNKR